MGVKGDRTGSENGAPKGPFLPRFAKKWKKGLRS
jgi:hypothetical protein